MNRFAFPTSLLFFLLLLTASGTAQEDTAAQKRAQERLEKDLAELEKRVPCLKELNRRIAEEPDNLAELYLERARLRVCFNSDREARQRALDDYSRALDRDPNLAVARWELAAERLRDFLLYDVRRSHRSATMLQLREIERNFDEALRLEPRYKEHDLWPFYRGVLKYATGEYIEAEAYLNRFLALLDEKNPYSESLRSRALQFRCLIHLAAENWDACLADYREASRPGLKVDEYLEGIIAVALHAKGDRDGALDRLDFYIAKRHHDLGTFTRWRALILLESKRFDEGVLELLRSSHRNWEYVNRDSSMPSGDVHFVPREIWDDVFAAFDEELELRPDDGDLWAMRGVCKYFHAYHVRAVYGEPPENDGAAENGEADFARALFFRPENRYVDAFRTLFTERPGNQADLIAALEKFLESYPGFEPVETLLCDERHQRNERTDREAYFKTVFQQDPAQSWKDYFEGPPQGRLSDEEKKKRRDDFEKSYRDFQEENRMDYFHARIRLLELQPDNIRLRLRLLQDFLYQIKTERQAELWPTALALARDGMDRFPWFFDFYEIHTQCYTKIHIKDGEASEEHEEHLRGLYTRWISLFPNDDRGYLKRAEWQRDKQQGKDLAFMDRLAALERNPYDVRNLMALAYACGWYGDWFVQENSHEESLRQAVDFFTRAIDLLERADPVDQRDSYDRRNHYPECYLHRGIRHAALKEDEKALADFTAVIELRETPQVLHDALLDRAKVLHRMGRDEESRRDIVAFLEIQPEQGDRVFGFYKQSRQWERQIEHLENEARRKPSLRKEVDRRIEDIRKERERERAK